MRRRAVIEALLFDMDGVVADTEEAVTAFWRGLAEDRGIKLSPTDFLRHVYGLRASHTLDVLFPGLSEQDRETALASMYEREAAGPYREIHGARKLLLALQTEDIPTALVTSADPLKVESVCRALSLKGLFSVTVTRDDTQRGKPDPEGYLLAARRLGVDAANCLVLEDAVSGVMAAVSAGEICVGVTGPDRAEALLGAGAAVVVPDLRSVSIEHLGGRTSLVAGGETFEIRSAASCGVGVLPS